MRQHIVHVTITILLIIYFYTASFHADFRSPKDFKMTSQGIDFHMLFLCEKTSILYEVIFFALIIDEGRFTMPKISQETIDRVEYVDVLDLAIRMGHWTNRSGNSTIVYCPNPNHSENTPDCKIKHTTGLFTCFGGGGCGAKGGPLQYYSWYTFGDWNAKTHFVDSVIGVCEIMGIEVVYEDGQAKKSVNYVYNTPPQRVNESIPAKSPEECHKVYQRMLSLCPIYREHALEWVNKRKYSKEQILSIGLKSIPATYDEKNLIINALLKEGYDLERIPGFTKKFAF